MIWTVLLIAFASERPEYEACLKLIKWEIDQNEQVFDRTLASTSMNPEDVIDKIFAGLFEKCWSLITKSEMDQILSETNDLQEFEKLVHFNFTLFLDPESIKLTPNQILLIDKLYEYTEIKSKEKSSVPFPFIFISLVVIFVIIFLYKKPISIKKMV